MHHFFDIPELLQLVFLEVKDKKTLAVLARTCSLFRDVALDTLWSEQESIRPLLQLLGPVIRKEADLPRASIWEFADARISSQRWETYKQYSSRIRSIKVLRSDSSAIFSPSIFHTIGQTRPFHSPLLPKLRTITVQLAKDTIVSCLPFLSDSIQELWLWIGSGLDQADMQYAFQEFSARLPNLKMVALHTKMPIEVMEEPMLSFLVQQQSLKDLTLPSSFLTSSTLTALSHSPSLTSIQAFVPQEGDPHGRMAFRPFQPRSFEKLRCLVISLPLEALLPVMADQNWAPQLTKIGIQSGHGTPTLHLRAFNQALANSVPDISDLTLDLFNPSADAISPSFGFEALLPLLNCRKMRHFYIRHRYPISITSDDLERMLMHWPNLVTLFLCVDPYQKGDNLDQAGLPFDVLDLFARLCPLIEKIGLLFDGSRSPAWPTKSRLEKLKQLHVGWTVPKEPSDVALYLASLCSSALTFGIGDHHMRPRPNGQRPPPKDEWMEVRKLFRQFCMMKERAAEEASAEARAISRELEAEKEKRLDLEWQALEREKERRLELEGWSEQDEKLAQLEDSLESERLRRLELEEGIEREVQRRLQRLLSQANLKTLGNGVGDVMPSEIRVFGQHDGPSRAFPH